MPISEAQAYQIVDYAWSAYDADGNGYLDRGEAKKMFTDLFASEGVYITDDDVDDILSSVDKDSDKVITKREMVRLLLDTL